MAGRLLPVICFPVGECLHTDLLVLTLNCDRMAPLPQEVAGRLLPDSCGVRLLLARCLVAQRCGPEAAEAVAAARGLAAVEDDLAAVEELEEQLRGMAA